MPTRTSASGKGRSAVADVGIHEARTQVPPRIRRNRVAPRVVMLLENNPYPADVRVRMEAETLAGAGYDVKVIAPREGGEARRDTVNGVSVSRYRLPKFRPTALGFVAEYLLGNLQLQLRGIIELLRGAEILHLHNPPDTLFVVGCIARIFGRKVVFDHHDLAPELFATKFRSAKIVAVLRLMERATFRCATMVLAPNDSYRSIALTRGGVAPGAVTVVRNGPRASTIVKAKVRGGSLDAPHLVFLGTMESQDGVADLPSLMDLLRDEFGLPRTRLTLIGDGRERRELEREFPRRGWGEQVRFTGRVDHDRVPALVAQADICIDPAPCGPLNDRSTMVKIAEYMAAGKPIVAYDLLETRRTAAHAALYANCGDVAELATHVARLAADAPLRNRLSEQGTERVVELTWEHSAEAMLDSYQRVLPVVHQT